MGRQKDLKWNVISNSVTWYDSGRPTRVVVMTGRYFVSVPISVSGASNAADAFCWGGGFCAVG
jgi:hypothetical protein